MGRDETDEYCWYPKIVITPSSLVDIGWKKSRLHIHPHNNLFCILGEYGHHIIFNKKHFIHIETQFVTQIECSKIKRKL